MANQKGIWPTTIILLITSVVIIGSVAAYFSSKESIAKVAFPERDVLYAVEVQDTPEERAKGLSGRERLEPGRGMVFLFDTSDKHGFWMPDMNFPIDIIWIQDNDIVHIEERVPFPEPGTPDSALPIYRPDKPANMVLEIPAGDVEKYGISVGDLTVFTQ